MFHRESWKPFISAVKTSKVKVTRHKKLCRRVVCFTLVSAGFFLVLHLYYYDVIAVLIQLTAI